jgi:seryl-tRNA synthetase
MTTYTAEANGTRKQSEPSSAKQAAAATATSRDIQDDFQELQNDVAKLSQQIAALVSAKGNETWKFARKTVDGVISDAGDKGKEAADAPRTTHAVLPSSQAIWPSDRVPQWTRHPIRPTRLARQPRTGDCVG